MIIEKDGIKNATFKMHTKQPKLIFGVILRMGHCFVYLKGRNYHGIILEYLLMNIHQNTIILNYIIMMKGV